MKIISVFFYCLALHNGCHRKNLERDTQYYYEQYREAGLSKKKFHVVKISELDKLEKLFKVNIQVYSLASTQTHGSTWEDNEDEENAPDITATLLCHSHRRYPSTLFLNLHDTHFPYIKGLPWYSKSFCCSRCDKYWKRAPNLRQHEKGKSIWNTRAGPNMSWRLSLKNSLLSRNAPNPEFGYFI